MKQCLLCEQAIDIDDPTIWRQVTGWVHGPKRDSLTMRDDTGNVAHDECIHKLKEGQAVDQPSLFE